MRIFSALAVSLALAVCIAPAMFSGAAAQNIERYTVYCADDRIEISSADLEQMQIRRGADVCQFQSYSDRSGAMRFAEKNFGGERAPCSC